MRAILAYFIPNKDMVFGMICGIIGWEISRFLWPLILGR